MRGESYADYPMFLRSPMTGFSIRGMGNVTGQDQSYMHYPLSWVTVTEGMYDSPVKLRYEGLDPKAHYRARIVYAGDSPRPKLRLMANDRYEVHGWIPAPGAVPTAGVRHPGRSDLRGRVAVEHLSRAGHGAELAPQCGCGSLVDDAVTLRYRIVTSSML